ncbi:hypothetical protein [Kribbella sp. NPDC051770]|uniref:hypothetical protein n=1 Tax=Kribbella sp. NPDC051770 TaxID=3155413 RepID=UPI003448B167
MLIGANVGSVGRALTMGIVELTGSRGQRLAIHAQCPFRLLHDEKILLGSADMKFPQRGTGTAAFDEFRTIFDSAAVIVNDILGRLDGLVSEVQISSGGALIVRWSAGMTLEVFPDSSGPVEAWRVLDRDATVSIQRDYGFPWDLDI